MPFEPDLPRYLQRIGLEGPTAPSHINLDALILAHVCSIPFENVDVLIGRRIELDPARIEHKFLAERRGGYCFEQNTYFMLVLRALGYAVTPISARVRIGRTRAETPPRTHVFLRVELADGSWLADVGVGGLSPTAALRLRLDEVQPTPHEPRRLQRDGAWDGLALRGPDARLFHQVQIEGAWQDVCDFTLDPMPDIDREIGNYYTSTHPGSHFRDRLTVARATPNGRRTLFNRRLTVRRNDGTAEVRQLRTPAELLDALRTHFGIELPAGAVLECPGLDWSNSAADG
jgi:N-hydroxyarylamine O-acetyltransferase